MTVTKHYQRNPDYVYRKIVEEVILVPIHQNIADMDCIYTLNGVGAFIWEQLQAPTGKTELHKAILDHFEVEPGKVEADLDQFLEEMTAIGAVLEVE